MALGEGMYSITSELGLALDLHAGDADELEGKVHLVTPNGLPFQRWRIATDPERPGRYTINCDIGNKYLMPDEKSDDAGNHCIFIEKDGSAYQSWLFEQDGDNWRIKNDGSQLYLHNPENDHGDRVIQESRVPDSHAAHQQWILNRL